MKPKILVAVFGLGVFCCCLSNADVPKNYKFHSDQLNINVSVPPAFIYVADSAGRRTGADPNGSLDAQGEQGTSSLSGLKEIPLSSVDQVNIGDDSVNNTGAPNPTTGWHIHISDGGAQTYTLNVVGLIAGNSVIYVNGYLPHRLPHHVFSTRFSVLSSKGQIHQIQLIYNPTQRLIVPKRVVSASDLPNDVQTACQLNLISPGGTCQNLETKADSIAKDNSNNDTKSEIQHLQVFLSALQSAGKSHVQGPAFTVLQEEAQALLNVLNGN